MSPRWTRGSRSWSPRPSTTPRGRWSPPQTATDTTSPSPRSPPTPTGSKEHVVMTDTDTEVTPEEVIPLPGTDEDFDGDAVPVLLDLVTDRLQDYVRQQ